MNIFQAALLGLVQGLTEFLPVSSSAHLVLLQNSIPGFSQPGILFDVVLHGGTLIAVLWYFRHKLLTLTPKNILLLILGTVPAVIVGFVFQDFIEKSFESTKTLGYELVITGFLCWGIDRRNNSKKNNINFVDSLIIGVFQAIAIIPGISRSGATMFGAISRGISKTEAANFSFLLSIPAIGGAIVLEILQAPNVSEINISNYLIGFTIALIVGYFSIGVFLRILIENKFKYFAYYSWILGMCIITYNLLG